MKAEITTTETPHGKRYHVQYRIGTRTFADTYRQGFLTYADALRFIDDPTAPIPVPPTNHPKRKPAPIPTPSDAARTLENWSTPKVEPRPVLDPTNDTDFAALITRLGERGAWLVKAAHYRRLSRDKSLPRAERHYANAQSLNAEVEADLAA